MPWERDADVRLQAQVLSPRRVADGNNRMIRGTRDGAMFTSDWLQALVLEGRGFCAGIGLLSAGEALPAAAITTLRPMLWLRVPTGITILPFYGGVQVEDTGGVNAFELAIGKDDTDVGDGTSDPADFGPVNLKTTGPSTLGVIARQEATANVSADPDDDLWRRFLTTDTNAELGPGDENFDWVPRPCPELVGPATLMLSIGAAAAPTVTAQFQWVEFLTSEIA